MREELKRKAEFVNGLSDLLRTDPRSSVDFLHYEVIEHEPSCYDEVVHIVYEGGYRKKILVTASSIGAIAKEILKEVY